MVSNERILEVSVPSLGERANKVLSALRSAKLSKNKILKPMVARDRALFQGGGHKTVKPEQLADLYTPYEESVMSLQDILNDFVDVVRLFNVDARQYLTMNPTPEQKVIINRALAAVSPAMPFIQELKGAVVEAAAIAKRTIALHRAKSGRREKGTPNAGPASVTKYVIALTKAEAKLNRIVGRLQALERKVKASLNDPNWESLSKSYHKQVDDIHMEVLSASFVSNSIRDALERNPVLKPRLSSIREVINVAHAVNRGIQSVLMRNDKRNSTS